jgi:hypothetical protein
MKTSQEYNEDRLKDYIYPEGIEKAPEGFTAKIMSRIQLEPVTVKPRERAGRLRLVPLISVAVTLILVAAAVFLPDKSSASTSGPISDFMKNIYLHLTSVDISSHIKFNIPVTFVYISVAVFMLSFFDRVLNVFFHRDK